MMVTMRAKRVGTVAVVGVLMLTAACSGSSKGASSTDSAFGDPGSCTVVELSSSPEKIDLMNALAKSFNGSDKAKVNGTCIFVRPNKVSSGAAATALATSWDESTTGHRPVIWSPAGSIWGQYVNLRLGQAGQRPIVGEGKSFMLTPLVIAMPEPMAQAIGYPGTPIGWEDILKLAKDQQGWSTFGHAEWGPFKLGKTNPNFSTSGLNQLVAQASAAARKNPVTLEDLDRPEVQAFTEGVESAVVHYGDTTLTFLNNLYKADQRGNALSYVSAVAVEEKSVIDYNQGNPDGILDAGEQPRPPRIPLVAIYPKEGTLFSNSPMFVLDAPWVEQRQKDAAQVFISYLQEPDNQRQVLQYHFRPGNTAVPIGDPITAANHVDPNQPQTLLEVPDAQVVGRLLEKWSSQRKKAKVTLVLDVSGSMGDSADPANASVGTKLDLAKAAVLASLDQFAADDLVALDIFTTGLGDRGDQDLIQLQPFGRIGDTAEQLRQKVQGLQPLNSTPLYSVTKKAYDQALAAYDPTRINAVVVLTDGMNDDGNKDDDQRQLQDLISSLRSGNEGQASRPVRVFTIGYGKDADAAVLKSIAEAASSASYLAKDPKTINAVLTAVISNF
jgi:Ca-activated chloride channel family protein